MALPVLVEWEGPKLDGCALMCGGWEVNKSRQQIQTTHVETLGQESWKILKGSILLSFHSQALFSPFMPQVRQLLAPVNSLRLIAELSIG